MEVYVLIDNKPQGPYTPELIRQYLANGQLQRTDLAAYPGRADWKPLAALVQSWGQAPPSKKTGASPGNASKRTALIATAVAALVLLAGAGSFLFWKSHTVAVITPADPAWPKSLAELNDRYAEPPPGKNAATYFAKGFAALQITDADYKSADLPRPSKEVRLHRSDSLVKQRRFEPPVLFCVFPSGNRPRSGIRN